MKIATTRRSLIWIILTVTFSVVTVTGGTLAWFTDRADPLVNEFTAGTVIISAEETVTPPAAVMENWNPGDEANKEYTIINQGTKAIYVRGVITGKWYDRGGITLRDPQPEPDPVTWDIVPELSDPGWVKAGNMVVYTDPLPGTYTQEDEALRKVKVTIRVRLDGALTDNTFQGNVFKLTAVFEAVQGSHGAVDQVWPDLPVDDPQDPPDDPQDPPEDPDEEDNWDAGKVYFQGDQVIYNGKVFEARNWTKGDQPGLIDSPWNEVTDQWRAFNIYLAGQQVVYNQKVFITREWTQDEEPGLLNSPWQEVTNEWRFFNRYVEGDIVTHNGQQWKAKWANQNQEPSQQNNVWKKEN